MKDDEDGREGVGRHILSRPQTVPNSTSVAPDWTYLSVGFCWSICLVEPNSTTTIGHVAFVGFGSQCDQAWNIGSRRSARLRRWHREGIALHVLGASDAVIGGRTVFEA